MLNHIGGKEKPLNRPYGNESEGVNTRGLGEIFKGFLAHFPDCLYSHFVTLPARVQLHLRCWLDVPTEQLGLHAGQRRVQPLARALLSTGAVFQHSGLLLLRGLSHRYVSASTPSQRHCARSALQPGKVPGPIPFHCQRTRPFLGGIPI